MDPVITAVLEMLEDRAGVKRTAAKAYVEAHEDYVFDQIAELVDMLEREIAESVHIA